MLQISKEESARIKKVRETLTGGGGAAQGQVKESVKKGVFGMFKK
jgi:hypothetical protein